MRPKIKLNSKIANWLEVEAIVLWPFILVAADKMHERLWRHEMKHWEQIQKYSVIGFYIMYLFYYFKNRIKGMDHFDAYWEIPFEIEARAAEVE